MRAAQAAQDVDVGDEPPLKIGRPKKKRIVRAPQKRGRPKKTRAAQAAPQDAACAAPDVGAAHPPTRISLGTVSERDRTHQQYSEDEENIEIPEAAQLNNQTALLRLDIGDLD